MRTHRGATLVELSLVLLLIATLCGLVWPPVRRHLDAAAATAAADAFSAAVARTRATAIARGGAVLVLDPPLVWIEAGDGGVDTLRADADAAVTIVSDGAPGPFRLAYDALGLGRLANRTLRFRRGSVERVVTVSAYGRVRRW